MYLITVAPAPRGVKGKPQDIVAWIVQFPYGWGLHEKLASDGRSETCRLASPGNRGNPAQGGGPPGEGRVGVLSHAKLLLPPLQGGGGSRRPTRWFPRRGAAQAAGA